MSLGNGRWAASGSRPDPWRSALLRALAWSSLAKFLALFLMWWLFFAGDARPTPESVSRHLQLAAPAAAPAR
jgi:hypothetical protein